jgi:DNA polymerase-3 subunit gamma/tau
VTISLAAKSRPARLSEVVGQRHATSVLLKALQKGALPQQILFSGGSGLGKTTLARCVAAALLCESPVDGDSCGACQSCLDISTPSRIHPDVVEFDAASNGQKEQIKDLATRAQTAPQRGTHRVYIIDEAHGLSREGGQAFLKLLEEPPPHVIFMLATTDPEKMLRTNRSRCVEFELTRPTDTELAEHLVRVATQEGLALSLASAEMLVETNDPNLGVRGLLMTLEKISPALSWGVAPSDDEVAIMLGVPPTAKMDALLKAVDEQDKARVLNILDKLRTASSDDALKRALTSALRRRLLNDPSNINALRFGLAVQTPTGSLHLDLLCARLASEHETVTVELVGAHLADARAVIKELRTALELSTSLRQKPLPEVVSETPSQIEKTEAKKLVETRTSATPGKEIASESVQKKSGASQQASAPASSKKEAQPQTDLLKPLLDALIAQKQQPAAAAIKAASPSIDGLKLVLSPPTKELRARLDTHRQVIKDAASKLGLQVSIRKTQ